MSAERRARKRGVGFVGFCLCLTLPVYADSSQTAESQFSNTTPTEQSATKRIDAQVFRADEWGLDESEWQRYQILMQGVRGSVSPATLSPFEVLGIHARSAEERRRYAERWAIMMRDDAERILAFQRAYDDAQKRLFPNGLLIDPGVVAATKPDQSLAGNFVWQPSDRVLFFTDTQCSTCDAVLERLVSQIKHFAGIDLYLVDVSAGDESRIRDWAASKQIDPQWVSEHKITLNIDAGALNQVAGDTGQQGLDLPILVLRREGRLTPMPASRF
ncbi:MAG: TIGR03759 family integrating conjugative element protein [Congregibacter sp.]